MLFLRRKGEPTGLQQNQQKNTIPPQEKSTDRLLQLPRAEAGFTQLDNWTRAGEGKVLLQTVNNIFENPDPTSQAMNPETAQKLIQGFKSLDTELNKVKKTMNRGLETNGEIFNNVFQGNLTEAQQQIEARIADPTKITGNEAAELRSKMFAGQISLNEQAIEDNYPTPPQAEEEREAMGDLDTSISHELRTPITPALINLDAIVNGQETDQQSKQSLLLTLMRLKQALGNIRILKEYQAFQGKAPGEARLSNGHQVDTNTLIATTNKVSSIFSFLTDRIENNLPQNETDNSQTDPILQDLLERVFLNAVMNGEDKTPIDIKISNGILEITNHPLKPTKIMNLNELEDLRQERQDAFDNPNNWFNGRNVIDLTTMGYTGSLEQEAATQKKKQGFGLGIAAIRCLQGEIFADTQTTIGQQLVTTTIKPQ